MRSVRVVLAAGSILIAAALGVALSRSPPSVARSSTTAEETLGYNEQGLVACQSGELLPAGTTAIRLKLGAFTGPVVHVEAVAGRQVLARGERVAGWSGGAVTVALARAPRRSSLVKLCVGWALHGSESVTVYGQRTGPALAARLDNGSPALGRIAVEYLQPGHSSWISLARSVARRMGLGHAGSGGWLAVLAAGLMAGAFLLSSRLVLRELR